LIWFQFTTQTEKRQSWIPASCEKLNEEVIVLKEKKEEKIITDPFGSYTGRPVDREEKPIQDADDL